MIILPQGLLAEIPADAVVWIVIGVVWAIAQVFTKMARRATNAETPEKQATSDQRRRSTRPTATHEPVSPNDELRRFLREISGEADSDTPPPTVPRPATRSAAPPPRSRTARPAAAKAAAPRPPAPVKPPTPVKPPARRPAIRPMIKIKPPPRDTTPAATAAKPVPGLGNWRTAIVHREIIGPPRALRAYDSSEF